MSNDDTKEAAPRQEVYAALPKGRPLTRAVWTQDRELAEDMLAEYPEGEAQLWCAKVIDREA